ncbi:hypothetical protein, partial [Bacteroides acidifaciens]|uniref:hypothetical protein n=1 Tax=Bacteroides acidifaciens TaxID=85831 RepID=UPI001C7D09E9
SSMVWRRFQQYFCVRLIPQNSMFSNFCHVVLKNYPKDNRSFSQNYLKQVKLTKTIPRDYGSIQFKGKPQVLTDLYGYEVVFDDANMYYFQK